MNENTIEIDLKNKPQPPLDFPHTCFELSYQMRAAAEAMTTLPDPWGSTDSTNTWRSLAFLQLKALIHETQMHFVDGASYEAFLRIILGCDYHPWKDRKGSRNLSPGGSWVMKQEIPRGDFEVLGDFKVDEFRTEVIAFSQNLERMGLFLLRLLEAHGKGLPATLHIRPPVPETGWTPIADTSD